MMVPLYKPYMPQLPQLDAILHSGALAYGEHSRAFERMLVKFLGTKQLLVTNTFNTAISVALAALNVQAGEEAIASPMACLASTQPYHAAGMKIVWADVNPKTGTLDPASVAQSITKKTKVIVHNHFCGYPGDVDAINAIGKAYGIPVIDDGIECFGSEYKGARIGSQSDIAVFSFNPVRLPNTVDGGALLLRDKTLFEKGLLIRDCGIDRSNFRDASGEISPACDITLTGFSATISNVNGYIGCEQMRQVDALIEKQRQNAAMWRERLSGCSEFQTLESPGCSPNYWVFGLLCKDKDGAMQHFREQGFYASGVHINNNRYSVFGAYTHLPGVEEFYRKFVALPCGWWVTCEEISRVVI